MKVLHAYNLHRGGGGADTACQTTIHILAERGIDIDVFARDSRRLPPGFRGKAAAFFSGIYSRQAVRAFLGMLEDLRPDVVHTHELYPLISPWILPQCTGVGIPTVITCYDYRLGCPMATYFSRNQICHRCDGGREHWAILRNCRNSLPESMAFALRSVVARKFRLFTSHASCFVVLTDFCRNWLIDTIGVPPEKVEVIPCAITVPDVPVKDPSHGGYVGFAGRLVHEKGMHVVIEAARRARLPLRLAGTSPYDPALKLPDGVGYVTTNTRQELDLFYRNARVIAVPSIWYETFGLVAAEAMSHGIPVIVSRIGALQNALVDGRSGLLFEPGNVGELADQLQRVWNDAALCRRLGANARQHVQENFSETAHYQRLSALYERLATRTPAIPAASA